MYRVAISLDAQEEDIRFIKHKGDYLEFVCEDCATIFTLASAMDVVTVLNDVINREDGQPLVYTFFLIRILTEV